MRPQIMPSGKAVEQDGGDFPFVGQDGEEHHGEFGPRDQADDHPSAATAGRFGDELDTGVLREHVADDLADDERGLELDLRAGEVEAVVGCGGEWFAEGVDAEVGGEGGDDRVGVHHRRRRSFEPGCDSAAPSSAMIGGSLICFLQPDGVVGESHRWRKRLVLRRCRRGCRRRLS